MKTSPQTITQSALKVRTESRSQLHLSRFTDHISCLTITLLPPLVLCAFLLYHIQRGNNLIPNTILDFFPKVLSPYTSTALPSIPDSSPTSYEYASPSQPNFPAPHLITDPLIYSELSSSQKYLQWSSKNDLGAGVKHRFHSWGCALGEAVALNRTFVFPTRFTVIPRHNHGRPETHKDIRLYIDVALLQRNVRLIAEDSFKERWNKLLQIYIESKGDVGTTLSQQKTDEKTRTSVLLDEWGDRILITRSFGWSYMYSMCYNDAYKMKGWNWIQRNDSEYQAVTPPYADALVKISASIKRLLGANYSVAHIRRGDRIGPLHPTLDNDTRPKQLIRTLPNWIPRGSAIYLATNEDAPNFFDPLRDAYNISSLFDYRHLWAEGSGWWNESSHLFNKNDSSAFDGMMEGIVDYMVMAEASTLVDTFGMLSPGNSHETTASDIAAWDFGTPKTKTIPT